jgi:P-type Ca2+ transporter type 2C
MRAVEAADRPMTATARADPLQVTLLSVAVRGRLRVRVAGLRRSAALATLISERLEALVCVGSVRVNPVIGSVLVFFDDTQVTVNQLVVEIARCRGPARATPRRDRRGRMPVRAPRVARRTPWHAMDAEAVTAHLEVGPDRGLSGMEAERRLAAYGANLLPTPEPKSRMSILVDQVATLPVALLAGAAAVSLLSGGIFDALVIVGVVVVNAAVGYITESRVERILTSLQRLAVPTALVRRDGQDSLVPAATLVPGDVVLLRAGHEVSADGRLLEDGGLLVNESLLTGESMPVAKRAAVAHADDTPLADRTNMVFAKTVVSDGTGLAVVTETGSSSEVGRIQALIAKAESPPTPLEAHLTQMGRTLVGVTTALCGLALGLGLLRGVSLVEMARTAIALGVAAVPEGLPAVATTTLALGMHRMLRRQALVRRLEVIESLGATTVICVDKTGTVTANRMTVQAWALENGVFVADPGRRAERTDAGGESGDSAPNDTDPRLARAILVAVLCNEAELAGAADAPQIRGSATEGALLEAARRHGLDYREVRNAFPLAAVRPRAEGQNWMATRHRNADGHELVAVKGAPEEVLQRSTQLLGSNGSPRRLTPKLRREILSANARMADQAMRVLGLAFREPEDGAAEHEDLIWAGLVGMADPIRPGVRKAIAACQRAGMRVVMLTGDQSGTAIAVGRTLGLERNGSLRVVEATQLSALTPEALRGLAGEVDIFARVSPAHKYQIVKALQTSGEVVAMTGDGINDGPALRAADIGVAMGPSGTDVARDLGDVVLLDDDLTSLVGAIEQGRTTHTNIRKALNFLLATNLSEILVTISAIALGVARPLSAVQLLWINLLSDVVPALALAVEPPERDVMLQEPRERDESILSGRALLGVSRDAALLAAAALASYGIAASRHGLGAQASTVAFATLTTSQLLHALSCRSETRSGLADLGQNPLMIGALGGTLALQTASVTVPVLRRLLGTTPLGLGDWIAVAAGATAPLVVREIEKAARRLVKGGQGA